jgi:hypothetical protein
MLRRAVGRTRLLLAERPRLLSFLPVLVRRARQRSPRGETQLPAVRSGRRGGVSAPDPPTGLTAFSIIRNGITNGYPFVESYGSWLRDADRIVIVDGESDDGTREALDELAAIAPHVEVFSRPWPRIETGGAAISELTQAALRLALPGASRLAYVQADEVYPAEQRAVMRGTSAAVEFAGYVNFWNSFDSVLANDFRWRLVRAFPAVDTVRSIGDGFSFDVGAIPVERTPQEVLHYGWCFPVNILLKHESHSRIYRDHPAYAVRGRIARLLIATRSYERRYLDALAPHYRPVPFRGEHPRAVAHLLDQSVYDPNVGLDLLAAGALW